MFSKGQTLIALAIIVLNIQCGKMLNETPPVASPPETKFAFDTGCLSKVLPVMREFMEGTARSASVKATWECFTAATTEFSSKVRGSNGTDFTPREVARFFEFHLMDEKIKISDELLIEIMHFKQIFVGGSVDLITQNELRQLGSFALNMRDISLELLPYMQVASLKWKMLGEHPVDADSKFFEDANLAIQKAVRKIADMIGKNDREYRFDYLITLLREMSKLYGESWKIVSDLERMMPMVKKFKVSLAGGDEELISAKEWSRFGIMTARGFIQYLRYHYFIDGEKDHGPLLGHKINFIFRSIEDGFSFLKEMVETKPSQSLSRPELFDIIDSLQRVFPDLKISQKLLLQLMKIKQLFFGGSIDNWTPPDFAKAQGKLGVIQQVTERTLGIVDFLTLKWEPGGNGESQAQAYFRNAEVNLSLIVELLGTTMETQYSLDDFRELLVELDKIYSEKSRGSVPSKILGIFPTIVVMKNILLNDQDTVIKRDQWDDYLKFNSRLFSKALYYFYFLKGKPITTSPGLNSFKNLIHDSVRMFQDLLFKKGGDIGQISMDEIDELVAALKKSDLIPKEWPIVAVKEIVRVVVNRVLVPPRKRLAGLIFDSLNRESFETAQDEFDTWIETQRFLEKLLPVGKTTVAKSEVLEALSAAAPAPGLSELAQIFSTPIVFPHDQLGRIQLELPQNRKNYSMSSLSYHNIARAVARLVIRAYVTDGKRIETDPKNPNYGIPSFTQDEADTLFKEVRSFFSQVGLLDPENLTFARSRFRESNLFTPRANGDEVVNFVEGVDVTLMLLSGHKIDTMMSDKFKADCHLEFLKEKDKTPIPYNCFISVYRTHLAHVFSSAPQFRDFLLGLNYSSAQPMESDFGRAMVNLLKASGYEGGNNAPLLEDLGLIPHVCQYIETVMQRFDQSKDGILEKDEGINAYPVFANIIRKLSGHSSNKLNRALLAYILEKGKPPLTNLEKAYFFLIYQNNERAWKISVNRADLGAILGYIVEASNKGSQVTFEP